MKSVYNILSDTIDNMDDLTLDEVYGAYEKDFGVLIKDMASEVYRILYDGKPGKPDINYYRDVNAVLDEQMAISSLVYFCLTKLNMQINWHHIE
jgi:hypothetical protein